MSRFDVSDLRPTIEPKSDQLNSEQLLGGSMTIRVTDVRIGSSDEQPVSIHYECDNGRPFKPCKTMRKVLVYAWGQDGTQWAGKCMTLYNDQTVKFGGAEVGGIRISHMSDITGQMKVSLTATKGKKALHIIDVLRQEAPPLLFAVLEAIASATNKTTMDAAKAMAVKLTNGDDTAEALAAYKARAAQLRATA